MEQLSWEHYLLLARAAALQSVAVRPATGNDVSGPLFWRERAAFQRSAFGRSTAGNDVVATIFIRIFFFFPFFF